jgi:hypothetical protein
LVRCNINSGLCGFLAKTPNILQMRGERMNDFDCAICVLEDYHDSEQFICDDCFRELESLKADQLASRWD